MRTWERNAASVAWAVAAYVNRFGTAGFAGAPYALWQPPQSRENVGGRVGAPESPDVQRGGMLPEPELEPVAPELDDPELVDPEPGEPELDAPGPPASAPDMAHVPAEPPSTAQAATSTAPEQA
jgi:hypothetical protein